MRTLSRRCERNRNEIFSKIPSTILEPPIASDQVDLSMAENHLIRPEVCQIVKNTISSWSQANLLDWPKGFWGETELLSLLTDLFNDYFRPYRPIIPANISVTAGAAACLGSTLLSICDDGDAVLVPTPYWAGFDAFLSSCSGVNIIGVDVIDFDDSMGLKLIDALEQAVSSAEQPIRALVISNPHNPLGRCYSVEMLQRCIKFCQLHGIHLISDEVFALSEFQSADLPGSPNFTSVLSIDPEPIKGDSSQIHAIWSMSKDFALSGCRVGCIVTQHKDIRDSVALLSSVNVSTMSSLCAKELLRSPGLHELIWTNKVRLQEAYKRVTAFLNKAGIQYYSCNASISLLCRLAPLARTQEEEMRAFKRYVEAGVLVVPGRACHISSEQRGWMRVSFAINQFDLFTGLERIASVYSKLC